MSKPNNFVTRAQWGSAFNYRNNTRMPSTPRGVALHWEGPRIGPFSHDQCAGKVRSIERFHVNTRGWAGIAYNAIVCPHGHIYEGRGTAYRSAANGNQTKNNRHFAVCYLGGKGDPFTNDGKTAFVAAVQWLRKDGNAGNEVIGHRDVTKTECPGDTIEAWLRSTDFSATPTTGTTYVVKAGDTLATIARTHGVNLDDLIAWNNITDPDVIHPGQVLTLTTLPEPQPTPPAHPIAVWGDPKTWEIGSTGPDVTRYGERIVIWSDYYGLENPYAVGPGPELGPADIKGASAVQVKMGYGDRPEDLAKGGNSDGYPGPQTFKDFAADPPTGVEVLSAIQNMAGNNTHGIRTAKTRIARYIAARKASPVHVINAQETTVASTVRPRLDSGLKPLGYARTGGGKGRYCYTRGVRAYAWGMFTVPSKWWFKRDDKQAAWVAYEIGGALGMDVSMHLEHRSGPAADALRVKQALSIAKQALAKAAYRKVPLQNVMLTGDTNSQNMVLDALVAAGWRNVAAGTEYENTYTFMGWDGRSSKRYDYALVRADAGPATVESIAHDTRISDHAGLRVRRTLTK